MSSDSLNDQLLLAVTYHKVDEVKRCLEQGADPNYDSYEGQSPKQRRGQPYTPLRMVVFCISDALLEDQGLIDFKEIAQLLIQYGADTRSAIELTSHRYGKDDPTTERTPFLQVLDVIQIAGRHDGA